MSLRIFKMQSINQARSSVIAAVVHGFVKFARPCAFAAYLFGKIAAEKTSAEILNTRDVARLCTVCPGSSDHSEKMFNLFAPENEVYTSY